MAMQKWTSRLICGHAGMPPNGLRKRPRDFKRHNLPITNLRKCPRCNENLPMHSRQRQAHEDLCGEINETTLSEAEEVGDEAFVDDVTCIADEVRSETEEQVDVHAWIEALAQRGTLSPDHMLKYINWGPLPLLEHEKDVAEFLSEMTSGVGVSTTNVVIWMIFATVIRWNAFPRPYHVTQVS